MKKGILLAIIVIIFIGVAFIIYYFWLFQSGLTETTDIAEYSLGETASLKFRHISSPLSSNSIQVLRIDNRTNKKYLLENYKNYDNMVGYYLCKDTVAIFLLKGYYLEEQASNAIECDTFKFNVNDLKWEIK